MVSAFIIPLAAAFPGLMAFSAAMDLTTMTIPNAIPLALTVGYVALATAVGLPALDLGGGASCGLATLAVTFVMFSRNWIGGGDAKLAAATALWLGWSAILDYAALAAILGGALALGALAGRALPLPRVLARRNWIARLHRPDAGVPYGVALATAGLFQFPRSPVWLTAVNGWT